MNNRHFNQEDSMSRGHKKAQSTLEYVLLVTAVVVVLITFVLSGNSPFKTALNSTLQAGTNGMVTFSNRLNR
jgi:uncharacterized protein (UPF0333 family)